VWVGPAIFAAIGIVLVVLIAVIHRHDRDDTTTARTTTTTTVERATTSTTRPVSGPLGGPGNPIPVGSAGSIGGWSVTILNPSDVSGAVQASVRLEWDGRSGRTIGDAGELSLHLTDPSGGEHDLGGAACAGDPADELAAVPNVDIGTSDTVPLCWSAPVVDRTLSMIVVRSAAATGQLYLALA
jgi:hypothetical protein